MRDIVRFDEEGKEILEELIEEVVEEIEDTPVEEQPFDKSGLLNANALITIEMLQQALVITGKIPEDDDLEDEAYVTEMARLINYISSQVETFLKRRLGRHTHSEIFDNSNVSEITLRNYPVVKVHTITFNGNKIPNAEEDLLRYGDDFDLRAGTLYLDPIMPSRSRHYGMSYLNSGRLRGIRVTYDAGYILPKDATEGEPSNLPADIEGAVLITVRDLFLDALDDSRTSNLLEIMEGNVQRKYASTVTMDMAKVGGISIQLQRVLAPYKAISRMASV